MGVFRTLWWKAHVDSPRVKRIWQTMATLCAILCYGNTRLHSLKWNHAWMWKGAAPSAPFYIQGDDIAITRSQKTNWLWWSEILRHLGYGRVPLPRYEVAAAPFHIQWNHMAITGSQRRKKWNESGFRPLLCTYRLNWARKTSWGWWDEWDDTALQTQNSKFKPWWSETEHATSR